MISPDNFIGMAEETGHIRPLTDWVIDRAIADQRQFRAAGHDVVEGLLARRGEQADEIDHGVGAIEGRGPGAARAVGLALPLGARLLRWPD